MRFSVKAGVLSYVVIAVALVVAPASFGQENGVTLDPGDPAAKEYALPHEQARREASGDSNRAIQAGSRDSAPFGEGISRDDKKGGTAKSSASKKALASAAVDADGPGSKTALMGGAAAVLFVVVLGGFALRALRGPDDV